MISIIPLVRVPAQRFDVRVGDKNCTISLMQKDQGLFIDLLLEGKPLIYGKLCQNRTPIVRYPYLKFPGDLYFVDTQSNADPNYQGFGTRWILIHDFQEAG